MQAIEAILFEPVGCLAEFPAEPFNEIAGRRKSATRSGSRAYWHLLNLMHAGRETMEGRELEAVDAANV